jgi:hypothetical protein
MSDGFRLDRIEAGEVTVPARGPDGYHPADSPAAGCDLDRTAAYAGRQILPPAGGYELTVADTADAGARCV